MGPNRTQRSARVPIQDAEAFLVGRLSSITKLSLSTVSGLSLLVTAKLSRLTA